MTEPIVARQPNIAVICMASEHGGVNGSLALALALKGAGWRVVYLGMRNLRDYVQARGFEYQVLPAPSEHAFDPGRLRDFGLVARIWPKLGRQAACIEAMIENHARLLAQMRPNVVLVDPVLPILGIAPLRLGLPIVALNPTLAGTPQPNVPPIFSHAAPGPRARGVSSARCEFEWARIRARRAPGDLFSSMVSARLGMDVTRLVRTAGGRTQQFEYGLKLDIPELVLAPLELEFPARRGNPSRHYLGTSVARVSGRLDAELGRRLQASKVAYGSLGTLNAHYPHRARFFQALVGAFGAKADWQLVVATGHLEPSELGPLPPNVLALKHVPQQELLAKASVFVTHGGAGSVREAIHFGVPMVVFPCGLDQNGLAARVDYHAIGVRGDIARVTSQKLSELVDAALSPTIAASMQRVQRAATRPEAMQRGVELLDRLAARTCDVVNDASPWYRATERVAD